MALPRLYKIAMYVTFCVLFLSGLIWFLARDVLDVEPNDLTRISLVLHGASAYGSLIGLGSVLMVHARIHWLRKRNKFSGGAVVVMFVALATTGLMLYYASDELRQIARQSHIVLGVLGILILVWHITFGKAARRIT